jgi:glycosyltransferase involved in cell wall biosynthesis
MSDGIGRQSIEIMETMSKRVSVGFHPSRNSIMLDVPESVRTIMDKKQSRLGKVVLYEDIFYPFSHEFFTKKFRKAQKNQVRLAYSMFESTKIPQSWVYNLNRHFDAVIVPDSYLVDTYKSSGVTIPVFVLPLGLNIQNYLQAPLKTKAHSPFVFANFSTCISRKNHRKLIHAFYAAFGNNPQVLLKINSKYTEEGLLEQLHKEIEELNVHNILLTNNRYDNLEYFNNFQEVDCYVSISQSEGFSIQPREAMALGIPCILSDNTAQSTICTSNLVESVPCPIQELAYYEQFQEIFGIRYDIDFEACVAALQKVYRDYPAYLTHSAEMRQWAAQYDYQSLHSLYDTLLKPKKIVLGAENTLDHGTLTTNSQTLYQKYQAIR